MMPLDQNSVLFLSLVFVGAVVQSLTGFAMALIILGGVAALGLAGISETAAVVSILSLFNAGLALRYNYRLIDYTLMKTMSIGMVPAVFAGLLILEYMSEAFSDLLRISLGVMIISAGILLFLKPTPYPAISRTSTQSLIGALGGVMAGTYGAGGAPFAYLLYRQPLDFNIVRATLLALFAISTLTRTVLVGAIGSLSSSVLSLVALGLPIVLIATLVSVKLGKYLPDTWLRKFTFFLLMLVGAFLIVK